jgi:hypothetical protein
MRNTILATAGAILFALPAFAQPMEPPAASPMAAAQSDAAIAHHDRKAAKRAARHGHMHKAAALNSAADSARGSADANAAAAGAPPPR